MKHSLNVYIRQGCHLCDALLDALSHYKHKNLASSRIVDIAGQTQYETLYGDKITGG